jgi:hypothetical protein
MEPLLEASAAEHEQEISIDDGSPVRFAAITARVLLMGGTRSPEFIAPTGSPIPQHLDPAKFRPLRHVLGQTFPTKHGHRTTAIVFGTACVLVQVSQLPTHICGRRPVLPSDREHAAATPGQPGVRLQEGSGLYRGPCCQADQAGMVLCPSRCLGSTGCLLRSRFGDV